MVGALPGYPGSTVADLKTDLIALATDATYAGANAATATLIPGVDTNPDAGVLTFDGGAKTVTATATDDTFVFENWDLTGWSFIVPDANYIGKIRNCIFGGDNSNGFTAYINGGGTQESKGGVKTIERCTFDGGGTLNPASFIHCRFAWVQNNVLKNCSDDYIKPSGWDASTTCYIQGNLFDQPVAVGNDTLAYNGATSYSVDEAIIETVAKGGGSAKPYLALALNAGILGAPPATWGSNTDWNFIDPHVDGIQADGKYIGPITYRWNSMLITGGKRNIGLTSGMWPQPHSTTTLAYANLLYENRIDTRVDVGGNNSFTRCFASPPAGWIGTKPKFYNNWLETDYKWNVSGGGAFDWGGNTQFDETAIPYNDADISGAGAVDYTPPARETGYPGTGIKGLSPAV